MPTSKEEAKTRVAALVAEHKTLTPAQAKAYHEAKTKQGFVVPLFRSLGWHFDNVEEVAPEEKASKGRVDYAFKLRGVSRFYLEAKPLRADLNDPDHIKQAVTYAYNKGVTWAGLTSFDRLRLFNAQTGQAFLNLTCQDYVDDFDRLWLLSRESVEAGALDKEAAKVGALPAPQPVEKRLFALLRQWREELFAQLHHYNPQLTFTQIDEVILRLFNRLIFIRNAEDRGIEEKVLLAAVNQWESSGHQPELIERLRQVFRQFDGYYDSDLFRLHPVDQVFIQSDTLARIIRGLYEVPGGLASYDFSVIDADVLGAVYEQYLGHVATVVKQRAKEAQMKLSLGFPAEEISLEAKRQKRKAQGIYYTPRWVTDYIVRQTVGRFISEHTHDEILNIKVLDPACGSGSFLIRAYNELLTYHAKVRGKPVQELDQWDRLPVLTGNIFGVDLDGQAVEIARLNLLLRSLARRETLPSLDNNIRRGNSLISGGEAELKPYFGDTWPEKHPFTYEQEFAEIMKAGGFDVVIGNPPWVFTREVDFGESAKRYFSDHYVGAKGKVNAYALFLWRGVNLLKSGGLFSMIVPNTFLRATTYEELRRNLLGQYRVCEISDTGSDVFPGVTASTVILLIKKDRQASKIQITTLDKSGKATPISSVETKGVLLNPAAVISIYGGDIVHQIAAKGTETCQPLSAYTQHLISGIQTWKQHKSNFITDRQLSKDYKPLLEGKDIGRYKLHFAGRYILYDKRVLNVMQDESIFLLKEKILIQRVAGGAQPIRGTLDTDSFYTFNSINTLVCRGLDNRYVLGCLNSKFMNWFYCNKFTNRSSLTVNISARFLRSLPIRRIDFSNPAEKKLHDDLVALVEKMIGLHQKRHTLDPKMEPEEWRGVQREIERTDQAIDSLVYDLYGLTEEERKIIEAST